MNNATCRDGVNNYDCLCLPGFTGNFCDTSKMKKCNVFDVFVNSTMYR